MVATASSRVPCYGRSGIRMLPTVDVAPLGRRVDEVAREKRELLDTEIQAANWKTELLKQELRSTTSG
jgi:hypothetical protein